MRNQHLQPLNPGDPAPGCHFRDVPGWGQGMFAKPYIALPKGRRKRPAPRKRVTIADLIESINHLKQELSR